eukprot:m.11109 g.11109  ORF g.11109 m.11109 type:complete len:98 (+) comp22980_c0_seq1:63-356(+)
MAEPSAKGESTPRPDEKKLFERNKAVRNQFMSPTDSLMSPCTAQLLKKSKVRLGTMKRFLHHATARNPSSETSSLVSSKEIKAGKENLPSESTSQSD